jgi:hypothetical protein
MPNKTRSLRMKRSRYNKKNTTTRKKEKDKRVWIYKMGVISLCYRVPTMKIKSIPSIEQRGGASNLEENISKLLFEQLPGGTTDKDIRDFLDKKDNKLVKKFLKSAPIASVTEELKKPEPTIIVNSELNAAGKDLLEWVKKRQIASSIIQSIKEKAKTSVTENDLETIDKTLNNENVCPAPGIGTITSMSSNAFNGVKEGAISLGSFLTPKVPEDANRRRRNDTFIQMLWYPRSNNHYRKGNSNGIPKDKIKYGDFMIYVEPEKYADITSYFSNSSNSVEDLFANVLNGCSDSFCLKGEAIPKPYKHQVLQINNFQPDVDDKELQKTDLTIA